MSRIIEETIFKLVQGGIKDNIAEGSIGMTVIDVMNTIEVGIDKERGYSQEVIVVTELEMQVTVCLGQSLELVLIGIE